MNTTTTTRNFNLAKDNDFMEMVLKSPEQLPPFVDDATKNNWKDILYMLDDKNFQALADTITDENIKSKIVFFRGYFLKNKANEIGLMKNTYKSLYSKYVNQFYNERLVPLRYLVYINDFDFYFKELCYKTVHLGKEKTLPYPDSEVIIYPGNPYLYIKKSGSEEETNIRMIRDYPAGWFLNAKVDLSVFKHPSTRINNPAFGKFQPTTWFNDVYILYIICKTYGMSEIYEKCYPEKSKEEKQEEDDEEEEEDDSDEEEN